MRVRFFLLSSMMLLAWVVSSQAGLLEAFGVQLPSIHKPAPDFSLAALDGGKKALSDEQGKIVLIHFWATWCVACRHEMPQLEHLWRRYRDEGLVVLGINVDRGNLSGVRDFVRQRHLSFPSVLDPDGAVRQRYEVRAFPTTYLIGRDGKIIGRVIGQRDWSSKAADVMIRSLFKRGVEP